MEKAFNSLYDLQKGTNAPASFPVSPFSALRFYWQSTLVLLNCGPKRSWYSREVMNAQTIAR